MITSNDKPLYCWGRCLEVRLYSKLYNVKPLIFGSSKIVKEDFYNNETYYQTEYISDQLNIKVSGEKKISALQDNGTVDISNLTYGTISQIILGQYYKIEIWAGYRTTGLQRFFAGEIAFISNEIVMRRDHTCHIIFASDLVAGFSQHRINFNVNSGINLYAALKYLCITTGIDYSTLNSNLREQVISEVRQHWASPANIIEMIADNTNNVLSVDSSIDNMVIDMSTINDKRQIRINPETISFRKGNPTLSSDGLNISILPTICFKPGDIIIIDNSIINLSENSLSSIQQNFNANYIDTSFASSETPNLGAYMIKEIKYTFENRGEGFNLDIQARALSIIRGTLGFNY